MNENRILSMAEVKEIEALFGHVPHRRAACIEALKIVQKHHRWVSDDALGELAPMLGMTTSEIDSIATFYNLIFRKPVGRHIILICNSVSCWVMGYRDMLKHLREKLKIDYGETTKDGRFTLLPIVCLGTCDHAPAMIIDEELYRDLETDMLDKILEKYV